MKDIITKEIQNRTNELRKEEAYRLGKMEGYQAGYSDALKEAARVIEVEADKPAPYSADVNTPMKHVYQNEGYAKGIKSAHTAVEGLEGKK